MKKKVDLGWVVLFFIIGFFVGGILISEATKEVSSQYPAELASRAEKDSQVPLTHAGQVLWHADELWVVTNAWSYSNQIVLTRITK